MDIFIGLQVVQKLTGSNFREWLSIKTMRSVYLTYGPIMFAAFPYVCLFVLFIQIIISKERFGVFDLMKLNLMLTSVKVYILFKF